MRKLIPFALLVVAFAAIACKKEETPAPAGGAPADAGAKKVDDTHK